MKCSITNQGEGHAEICLYDEIDAFFGVGAKQFHAELAALGDVEQITLRINSPGGSVWEGMAVLAMLRAHPAKIVTRIEGLAASMASVVAMAGDEIEMPANAFMMIHNPLDFAIGDAAEMRKHADVLDQVKAALVDIYAQRSGRTIAEIGQWMDDETWMDGATCKERGFCTAVLPAVTIAASLDAKRFTKTPASLIAGSPLPAPGSPPNPRNPPMPEPADTPQAATLKELRAACPGADEKFLVAQLEAEATAAASSAAWMTAQQKRIDDLHAKLAAAAGKPGVTPRGGKKKGGKKKEDGEAEGDEKRDDDMEDRLVNGKPCDDDEMDDMDDDEVKDLFETKIAAALKRQTALGRQPDRRAAIQNVCGKNPRLHGRWLAAVNPNLRGRRLVAERMDLMPGR